MSDEKTAKRRVTLRDVAQAAGVSLKTASNVINGSGRMTDETRAKVESVIKDLDYRVNVAARNLNRDHTGFITLAVPSLIPPYLAELANRTIEAARQRDYSVYVTTYAEGSAKGARDLLKKFNSTVSDGMILSMSEVENISPDDLYYLWHYAAVDAGGRCCKISFLLRSQTSASCKAHVLGECPFPCTDAALGNRRCCFTQKNRIFPIPLRASGWCSIDRYPDFFHRRTGKSLLPWI